MKDIHGILEILSSWSGKIEMFIIDNEHIRMGGRRPMISIKLGYYQSLWTKVQDKSWEIKAN
jgi:hypothetical protein